MKTVKNGNGSKNGHGQVRRNAKASRSTPAIILPELKPDGRAPKVSVRVTESQPNTLTIKVKSDRPEFDLKPKTPWSNPTQFDRPSFAMSFPFSYATGVPNNPWMEDMKGDKRNPDFTRAAVQFLAVYQNIGAEGLVYLV